MTRDTGSPGRPQLRLVSTSAEVVSSPAEPDHSAKDVDWSILMARAQAGDAVSYRRLLREIAPYLRSLAARHRRNPQDIEDVVQEILMTIHSIRATYDVNRPFMPWLTAIARRRLVDQIRSQMRRSAREQSMNGEEDVFADPRPNSEDTADQHRIEEAVAKLPPVQQQAIRLLKLNEMSLKEASAISGASIPALKVATHRAIKSLRDTFFKGSRS
jgi:RNA polymerase sigma-70 factor (ECF subfamily)